MDDLKEKPFFIAEIGINHNGDMNIVKKLIDMASECGCHAVKFQKRDIDTVYSKEVLDIPRESPWGKTTREQKEGLELNEDNYNEIDQYCKEKNIEWFASAWDIESLKFLDKYNLTYNKIASAMLLDIDFVKEVAKRGKITFISTGMSDMNDIDVVVNIFKEFGCPFILMHAVSTYPCPNNTCNIKMIKTLKERFSCEVGYSGHEVGLLPSILAVSEGAVVIERHITLDRTMYGSDQSASLEKHGLEILIRDSKQVNDILGDGIKSFSEQEKFVAKKLRYFIK